MITMWTTLSTDCVPLVDNPSSSTESHRRDLVTVDNGGQRCGHQFIAYAGMTPGCPQSTRPTTTTHFSEHPDVGERLHCEIPM